MIGLGTLFKKNVSNWDAGSDPISEYEAHAATDGGRREIRPRLNHDACGVCGRTLLTGERADVFMEKNSGGRIVVCSHCRPQTLRDGLQQL